METGRPGQRPSSRCSVLRQSRHSLRVTEAETEFLLRVLFQLTSIFHFYSPSFCNTLAIFSSSSEQLPGVPQTKPGRAEYQCFHHILHVEQGSYNKHVNNEVIPMSFALSLMASLLYVVRGYSDHIFPPPHIIIIGTITIA